MDFAIVFSIDDARYVIVLIQIVGFLVEMYANVGAHATIIFRSKINYLAWVFLNDSFLRENQTHRNVLPL